MSINRVLLVGRSHVLVGLLLVLLAGCQPAGPTRMVATGGILMTQPSLKFDGKVGDKQYEPFEIGPISTRIGGVAVITTATMDGTEFSVVAPKPRGALDGMTLVHEALRGSNIKTTDGNAEFKRKLKSLFAIHRNEMTGAIVTAGGVVVDLK